MPGRFSTTPLRVLSEHHQCVGIVEGVPRKAGFLEQIGVSPRSLNLRMWANSLLAPYWRIKSGRDPQLVDRLRALDPECLCISNFPHLFPREIFDRWPTYNLHPSLLPRWRGPYPWFWMYHAMDENGGWTVHRVDQGEDTGPILAQKSFKVPFGSTVTELGDKVLEIGGEIFSEVLDEKPSEQPQKNEEHPRARRPRPGERFVDWGEWPVKRVYHFLRGVCPLWTRELNLNPLLDPVFTGYDEEVSDLPPGQIGKLDKKKTFLACKDGRVHFHTRLRYTGGK